MGNCQAAEAATVVIEHPGRGSNNDMIQRIYWSVSARQVMDSNPGHYVALVINSHNNGTPLRQFKLLRPNDTLLIGQVYRLISFDELLKEFAEKKCVKLGKLLMERVALGAQMKHRYSTNPNSSTVTVEREVHRMRSNGSSSSSKGSGGRHHGGGQWRPALQSIEETNATHFNSHAIHQ